MLPQDLVCDVCHGETGGRPVGVACIPGAPMSIAWCTECLQRDSAPTFVFDHDFVFVAEGDIEHLNAWARSRVTWVTGEGWVTFEEYVKRITPEDVARQLKEFNDAMHMIRKSEDE